MDIRSETKKKIILLLLGGVALGLSTSPRMQKRVLRIIGREWRSINRQKLYRNIRELERDDMVRYRRKEEWWNIELTEKGKKQAKKLGFDGLKIDKPKKWDKKWRVVIFDIPEKKKIVREVLRKKIQDLGFQEIQKSVFVHPYPCSDEITVVIKFFKADKFVKKFIATNFDKKTERHFMKKFNLKK
ncbi:MAG: CRISPR-associated endonuclease Cas2 [Candidatus Moranbacteria bacterium]|nr:CRISPR-associated endonuclease Cas2 [Candidatus Moranbacteria bacterium]